MTIKYFPGGSGSSVIDLGADAWQSVSGSPSRSALPSSGTYRAPVWSFPQASGSILAARQIPSDWANVKIVLEWANNGAGAGTVAWQLNVSHGNNAGVTIPSGSTLNYAPTAISAGSQNVSTSTTLVPSVAMAGLATFRLWRLGSGTLANDAAVIRLRLSRA